MIRALTSNNPAHWRQRADEMHAIAGGMSDPYTKAIMLRLAADYEELALREAERAAREAINKL